MIFKLYNFYINIINKLMIMLNKIYILNSYKKYKNFNKYNNNF
jgi:hypothetical protein